MKVDNMEEINGRDDPLTRIQREIIEVTERENEFKKVHPTYNRMNSDPKPEFEPIKLTNGHSENHTENPKTMSRAFSTPFITNGQTQPPKPATNGFSRRYIPNNNNTRGIMQRFIASGGKMNIAPMKNNQAPLAKPVFIAPIITAPVVPSKIDGKPIRKGFVPVEEKIQKELKDLKDREIELKKQRRKASYQFDFSSLDDSDKEVDFESDDDTPAPGSLRPTKSIGELYESLGDNCSPSPSNGSGPDSYYSSMKPAKSLAELCEFGPEEQAQAPSSTKLIAKWESLIQQKQESGAA